MAEDFLFDTSIWIDIHENRGLNGESVKKLIKRIIENDQIVIYSDLNIGEFKHLGYSKEEINCILSIAKPNNLQRTHIFPKQVKEATILARKREIPKKDALHAILARDNNLQLITRDTHFNKLKDIALTKKPEDII
ncbi:MAG: PIN domain-containing protein [Candidatus Woesearchaeota archaeon]|jgi:predicted nucleic acid-binding protein|nr:PIN domain-containing protein [Candidatus Woesearchaeota archaeon]MDP7457905.1 PIN domain-containing protein [Candidatus Woesearchaeota archaeon]